MAEYLGKLQAFFHDFNELLPPASNPLKIQVLHVSGFAWPS